MAVRCLGRSLAFSLLLPIAALAGCGPGAEEVDPTGTARAAGPGPVVVDRVYGTTRVEGVPEWIVTIDLQWTDTMLALGAEPVGYTVDTYMPDSACPGRSSPTPSRWT
jgi:iron complex transport system substrate-binding protein